MGIVHYFGHLYRRYHNDMTMTRAGLSDLHKCHLFFDFNSLIHPCVRKVVSSESDSQKADHIRIDECIKYTKDVIDLLKPQRVYIYIDGVAPRAKINQQRLRRYKSAFETNITEAEPASVFWNTNKITPGTLFMRRLSERLRETDFGCITDISDSDTPGEGEHKMTPVIAGLPSTERVVIYGLDADLIMLSLINKNSDRIVLLRDPDLDLGKFVYVDIHKLKNCIQRDTGFSGTAFFYDYIVLCMLLGNDFLHCLPSLSIQNNGIQCVLECYKKVLRNLGKRNLVQPDELSICPRVLQGIFRELSVLSGGKRSFRKKKLDDVPVSDTIHYYTTDFVELGKPGYEQRYYAFHGIHHKATSCEHYIRGLYWVLGYYAGHAHKNWDYYYPYSASPLVKDICAYLETHIETHVFNATEPMLPMQQLFMVLPRSSLCECLEELDIELYNKIQRLFRSGLLDLLYPEKICIYSGESDVLWKCPVLLDNFPDTLAKLLYVTD